MSRALSLAAAAAAAAAKAAPPGPTNRAAAAREARAVHGREIAHEADSLLPPAIKGITLGFVGGVIVIVALMMFAPSLVHADEMGNSARNMMKSSASDSTSAR